MVLLEIANDYLRDLVEIDLRLSEILLNRISLIEVMIVLNDRQVRLYPYNLYHLPVNWKIQILFYSAKVDSVKIAVSLFLYSTGQNYKIT